MTQIAESAPILEAKKFYGVSAVIADQQQVLAQARQGNTQAIASILNQAFVLEQVWATVSKQGDRLHIHLESSHVPERTLHVHTTRAVLLCLGLPNIRVVQIYGHRAGDEQPDWQEEILLDAQPAPVVPVPVAPPRATLKQSAPKSPSRSRRPSQRKVWRYGILGLIAASFVLGTGLSVMLRTQLNNAAQPVAEDVQVESGASANGNDEPTPIETLEPAPPPSLKEDETLLNKDLPYFGSSSGVPAAPTSNPAADPADNTTSDPAMESDQSDTNSTPAASDTEPKAEAAAQSAASPETQPSAAAPAEDASSDAAANPIAADTIVFKAVGDIIPGTNFPHTRLPSDLGMLFANVQPYLAEADIVFGNFESTLTDYPSSAKDVSQGMTFAFRTPPHYAGILKAAGFDVLSVANNHSMDFYEEGFNDTIENIEKSGMKAVGRKDQIVYQDVKGIKTAYIAFSYLDDHNSMHDIAAGQALVKEASENADIVVISVHAGAEGTDAIYTRNETEYFYSENRGNSVQFARAMIDAGADVVLGHGPHVPRAMELYQGKLIAYSLGNFMGYRTLSTVGTLGNSMILQFQLDKQGDFQMGRIIPIALDDSGIPYLDDYFQTVNLVRTLTQSDFPQTPLVIDDQGYIRRTDS
ncbi:MAG: CapA family protein [Thainema sp.]